MPIMKFKLLSLSGITANKAVLCSPRAGMFSSSWHTTAAICGRLNFSRRTPREISMLLAVLPETNCQGLFNQIHKKSTKRCQKHRMAPDTSFDRLHFSVQQVFAEIRIVWQLVDIWLPAPLDFGQFQRIGCFQCMIVACHI